MEWLKENWFKFGILIVLLVAAGGPAYYFGFYVPKHNDEVETSKALDQSYNSMQLQDCLDKADRNYNTTFTEDCKLAGNSNCDTNPTLSLTAVQILQKDRDNQKDFCFKQYPQN